MISAPAHHLVVGAHRARVVQARIEIEKTLACRRSELAPDVIGAHRELDERFVRRHVDGRINREATPAPRQLTVDRWLVLGSVPGKLPSVTLQSKWDRSSPVLNPLKWPSATTDRGCGIRR